MKVENDAKINYDDIKKIASKVLILIIIKSDEIDQLGS